MVQLKGFVAPGQERKVCKLVKSLYGLKQAPKQWHKKFDKVIFSNGFNISDSDKCVYIKNLMLLVLFFVYILMIFLFLVVIRLLLITLRISYLAI